MKNNLLSIQGLDVVYKTDYGTVRAVNQLNLTIGENEVLGFVGETGAGKTTTALSIMKLLPKDVGFIEGGEIFFEGRQLNQLNEVKMRSIRGEKISMIFQDPMTSLDPVIPIIDQVVEMIRIHKKCSRAQARALGIEILGKVGIKEERVNSYPHEFSGGMKQRVVIAIALVCEPKLIIADEPTTALDVTIQAQVLELMQKLKAEYGTSMMLITHDLGVVGEMCDTVAIMYCGSIVEYGKVDDVFDHPRHPYTIGLFNSIPDIDDHEIERLSEIKGFPPEPTKAFQGCPFSERCNKVMDRCKVKEPPLVYFNDSHYAKCFLYEKEVDHV